MSSRGRDVERGSFIVSSNQIVPFSIRRTGLIFTPSEICLGVHLYFILETHLATERLQERLQCQCWIVPREVLPLNPRTWGDLCASCSGVRIGREPGAINPSKTSDLHSEPLLLTNGPQSQPPFCEETQPTMALSRGRASTP